MTTVTVDRTIDAPPHEVFDAWTTGERLARWWWPQEYDGEFEFPDAAGAEYEFVCRDLELRLYGEIVALERPERLAVTQLREDSVTVTSVTVEFRDHGERTRVVVVHEGFTDPEEAEYSVGQWNEALDRLLFLFKTG